MIKAILLTTLFIAQLSKEVGVNCGGASFFLAQFYRRDNLCQDLSRMFCQ
jgi:hypothetical protein